MTCVLIVDDERCIQKAFLAEISSASDRYTPIDAVVCADDAISICAKKHIDLILMDVNTANNANGINATLQIKKRFPEIKIIITTAYTDPRVLAEAKKAGADSFWFKNYSPIDLIEVMDKTMEGTSYWPSEVPNVVLGKTTVNALTSREKEVLHFLADYISTKKIAENLFIEECTVKTHLKNICNKVGCKNKTELLIKLLQAKLVLPL